MNLGETVAPAAKRMQCGRALADLQSQLGDDPDDVLSCLEVWPDVILHGDKLFSYDNRRAWAIKHCRAHRETRIWVRLYLSPDTFNMEKGLGKFEEHYSTTSERMDVELTPRGHKRKLEHFREPHVSVPDAIMHDCKAHLISKYNLSDIECIGASKFVMRGAIERDLDRAAAFLEAKQHDSAAFVQSVSSSPTPAVATGLTSPLLDVPCATEAACAAAANTEITNMLSTPNGVSTIEAATVLGKFYLDHDLGGAVVLHCKARPSMSEKWMVFCVSPGKYHIKSGCSKEYLSRHHEGDGIGMWKGTGANQTWKVTRACQDTYTINTDFDPSSVEICLAHETDCENVVDLQAEGKLCQEWRIRLCNENQSAALDKYWLVGSVSSWEVSEEGMMLWDDSMQAFCGRAKGGKKGQANFQIWIPGDSLRYYRLYPSVKDARSTTSHIVCGPTVQGHGYNWWLQGGPGKCIYQVMPSFNDTGSATVNWRVLP